MASACSIRVRGVVQGVGFRPFVYRLACANTLNGWVLNAEEGVEIHLEGAETGLEAFVRDLKAQPPPAASIAEIDVQPAQPIGLTNSRFGKASAGSAPQFAFHPTCRSAMTVLRSSSTQLIRVIYTRISTARTAARVTASCWLALRPAQHHHETMAARRILRRGIFQPGQPSFSRAARSLPSLRSYLLSSPAA
jgi:acylphosphatase